MTEPFIFANGQAAHSSQDLVQLCKDFPTDGIRYLLREDLEKWLVYIGDDRIAQYASKARTADVDDAQKLDSFLSNLQSVAKKAEVREMVSAPVAVKEPEVKNVAVAQKVAMQEVAVPATQEVVTKTEISAEPLKAEAKNIKAAVKAEKTEVEKTNSDQTVVSKQTASPKTRSNIFHWIADFFRS